MTIDQDKIREWANNTGFSITQRVWFMHLLQTHYTLKDLVSSLGSNKAAVCAARASLVKRGVLTRKCDEQGNWHYYA